MPYTPKTISVDEAHQRFDDLVEAVATGGRAVALERDGEPVAFVVSVRMFEQWRAWWSEYFEQVRQISERANMDADEAEALVAEAVAAVRGLPPGNVA